MGVDKQHFVLFYDTETGVIELQRWRAFNIKEKYQWFNGKDRLPPFDNTFNPCLFLPVSVFKLQRILPEKINKDRAFYICTEQPKYRMYKTVWTSEVYVQYLRPFFII